MKNSLIITALLATSLTFGSCNNTSGKPVQMASAKTTPIAVDENTKIQVALLLDTSNSMDGLIEQAKSRLWNIVNTLTTLKYSGKTPTIEIALYNMGTMVYQVSPITSVR